MLPYSWPMPVDGTLNCAIGDGEPGAFDLSLDYDDLQGPNGRGSWLIFNGVSLLLMSTDASWNRIPPCTARHHLPD